MARHVLQARARRAAAGLPCPAGYHRHHWSYKREHWTDVIALPSEMHARWHSFIEYVPEAMCFTDGFALLDTREKHVESMARHLRLPRA